jgi:hypothetical protein
MGCQGFPVQLKMVLTNRDVSVGRYRKLFDDPLRSHASLSKVTEHLLCCSIVRLIARGDLYSVILGVITSYSPDIRGHLAVF